MKTNATPPWRKIRKEIEQTAPTYVVACSGGVDSVFLLDFISKCKVEFVVAYFDHGLGNGDVSFVRKLSEKYSARFFVGTGMDLGSAKSIESEARKQRYAFLNQVVEQTGSDKIILGHHLDDQVEGILLRLLRGYSHSSLGMDKISGNRYRPFLEIPKQKLIEHAERLGLTWLEDSSNNDIQFERNFLRHEIIPKLLSRRNIRLTIPKGLGR